jgi:hypothetical protein
MTDKRILFLVHDEARRRAVEAVQQAPEGYRVTIEPPKRTGEQNARFHAICGDLAGHEWAGKPRNASEWKVLLVSGHAAATKEGAEMVPGLENEFVNLRESTAAMSKRRGSSLIEYAEAYCARNGIKTHQSEPNELP